MNNNHQKKKNFFMWLVLVFMIIFILFFLGSFSSEIVTSINKSGLMNGASVLDSLDDTATSSSGQISSSTPEQISTSTPSEVSTSTEPVSTSTPDEFSTSSPEQISTSTPGQISTSTADQTSSTTPEQISTTTLPQTPTPIPQIINSPLVITGVLSPILKGTFHSGVIPIIVAFNRPVIVTGAPKLILFTGNPETTAVNLKYKFGNQLYFLYHIVSGNSTSLLDYVSSSALDLNGGSIKDYYGNEANLDLPSPGSAGSLSDKSRIAIDSQP